MTVAEWLQRLNLIDLAPQFAKMRIISISDLRTFTEEKALDESGITFKKEIYKKRLHSMIAGKDETTKQDF